MELVNEGGKSIVDSPSKNKAKTDFGVAQSSSITSYFQRTVVPKTSKPSSNNSESGTMETPTLTTKKNSGNIQDQQFKRCASKDSCRYNNCSKSSRSADCGPENKGGASDDQQNYYLDGKSDRHGDGDCHDHDKDRMNDVVPLHGVSGCHNHGHANMDHSSGGFGNVLNQKNEDGDCTDGDRDDDDKDNHTKIRRSPSLNKSKWNFTWKTTQKTSKATELDFLDSDTDFEECARQVVTADAIKSQENPRYDTIQKKRFKRHNDNRKTQSKNREIDEASEEAESIRTDNHATLACPFNNVLVLCEKTQHVNTSFVKENVGSVIKDSKCSKECILQLPQDDVKDRANISSDLPLQKTIQLEDNTLSVERDKRCEDKLIKPEKTAFEVLMERSKAQALLKETSAKAACQEPEKEIVEQAENPNQRQTRNTKGNLKKDKVGKKGRNFKLTSQQNVSGVVGIRENIDEDSCEELEVFHHKNATAAKRKKIDEPKTKDNTYRTSSDDSDKEETTQQESERGAPPGKMSRRTRRKSLRIASKGDNSDSSAQKLKRSSVNEFSSRKGEEATEFCNKAEKERTVVRRIAIKNQWKRKCCHMNEKQVNLQTRIKSEGNAVKLDENSKPSASRQEQKRSTTNSNKPEEVKEEHVPKKATGSIAPIFLPGAWRRAKYKVEQQQLQESKDGMDHIDEDLALKNFSENSIITVESNITKHSSNESCSLAKDSNQNLQAFMGKFKKSPMKFSPVVEKLIDAPFPKVSHVQQIDVEFMKRWNLPVVKHRFWREEFFLWTDHFYENMFFKSGDLLHLSGPLDDTVQNVQERTTRWKNLQFKKVPGMSDDQREAVIRYLKKVYPGVAVKKWFKKCQLQLERFLKAEEEPENSDRHFVNEGFAKCQLFSKSDSEKPLAATSSSTSLHGNKKFTKICEKNSATKTEGMKLNRTNDSPLLMAFNNQDQQKTLDNNEKDFQISKSIEKKKELPKKTSLRDYLCLPSKDIDKSSANLMTNQRPTKSNPAKRKCDVAVDGITQEKTRTCRTESKRGSRSKRRRESEGNTENRDKTVEGSIDRGSKKVKLVVDDQDLMQLTKGRKGKQYRPVGSESLEVVDDCPTAIESATDTLTETPKSPKISSDEDFINKPKIGNISATGEREITARRKHNGRQGASRGSGNGATRETCSTKSSMLQTNSIEREMSEKSNKSDAKDSQVEEILTDGKDDLKEILDSQISRKSEAGNDKVVVLEICDVPEKSQSDVLQKQLSDQISCENTADNAGDQRPPVLWTECFRPGLSGEILGNNSGGSILKKWLSEWKYVREKKLNEMKRLQKKKLKKSATKKPGRGESGSEWWHENDDISDFDLSDASDYSYNDEDKLCNTMLLTGPVGCGKTSAVYACAEELGFKVIEVNSSSKRGGKYILSEFQEATQSHQVTGKRASSETHQSLTLVSKTVPPISENNNYNSSKKVTKRRKKRSDKEVKGEKKERKTKSLLETLRIKEVPGGQMSLILLDEVDILFEEDKGFWIAVNSLRRNSKRPIVMTSSDPTGSLNVDGTFEHISMKSPPAKLHASYIQSMCLSKNVFVSPPDLHSLALRHHGDVRRSLLNLQFWIDSNAGYCDPGGISFATEIKIDTSTSDNLAEKASFSVSEKRQWDNKAAVYGSLTTNNMKQPCDSTEVCDTSSSNYGKHGVAGKMSRSMDCVVHQLCLESYLGLRNVASANEGSALKVLASEWAQDTFSAKYSFVHKSTVTSHCQTLGVDITRCNMETLLPCLFAVSESVDDSHDPKCWKLTKVSQSRSRPEVEHQSLKNENEDFPEKVNEKVVSEDIFVDRSLFDDEREDDKESCWGSKLDDNSNLLASIEIPEFEADELEKAKRSRAQDLRKKLLVISLEALDHFFEDMSFMDSELCCDIEKERRKRDDCFDKCYARVLPGVEDTVDTKPVEFTWKTRTTLNDMRGAMEVASLEGSHKHFHHSIQEAVQDFEADSTSLISDSCDYNLLPSLCPHWGLRSSISGSEMGRYKALMLGRGNITGEWKAVWLSCTMPSDPVHSRNCAASSSLRLSTSIEGLTSKTKEKRERDFVTMTDHLPVTNQLNRFAVALDYVPTLRNICRTEALRRASRTKRRFYHYFDSVGLQFSQSTIQFLTGDNFSHHFEDVE